MYDGAVERAITSLEAGRGVIGELCKRHGVARLEVFGSVLRADFATDTSDIDFLVELIPMAPYERVDAYFGLLEDLRKQLGQQVHLVMAGAVKNRFVAADIKRTKQLVYAA